MATLDVSSRSDLLTQALEYKEVSGLNNPIADQRADTVTFTLRNCFKTVAYTVSFNDKNELQVTWKCTFLGFISFTQTITTETKSHRYQMSQKILAFTTVNPHLNAEIRSSTIKSFFDIDSGNSTGIQLSRTQLYGLLRNTPEGELLELMKQLRQRDNYHSKLLPAMAEYLSNAQIEHLIHHMIDVDNEQNREEILLILKHLPVDRQGNFKVTPFDNGLYFAAGLNDKEFQVLCLALNYQQAMALMNSTHHTLPEANNTSQSLRDLKYQELWNDAKQIRKDCTLNGNVTLPLSSFPSRHYLRKNEISDKSTIHTLQIIMIRVVELAQNNPDAIPSELTHLPCTEIAQMMGSFNTFAQLPTVTSKLTDAKLSLILKTLSAKELSDLIPYAPKNQDMKAFTERCARLDDRLMYLAQRKAGEPSTEAIELGETEAFNYRLLYEQE